MARKFLLLAAVAAAFAGLADKSRREPFEEGARVVCLGDSITHGGLFPYYLQFAQLLRHPGSTARVFNAGVSGGTCGGALKRWEWDVKPIDGTLTFLMFGMNDVNQTLYKDGPTAGTKDARDAALKSFAANERRMADTILATGGSLALVTPTPYDEYGTWQKSAACPGCNETGLAACAQAVRSIAKEKNVPLVELHRPLTESLKRGAVDFRLADRTHPDTRGHLAMLKEFLAALGVSREIAGVTISADGKHVETRHAKVRDVRARASSLEFVYSPESLPFPGYDDWHEPLKVTGLPEGSWEVCAAGVRIGVFTDRELERGIDLARLETPSMIQARKAYARMFKWRGVDLQRRNLVKMDVVAHDLGVDPRDAEKAFGALDKWYESRISKGSSATYYRNLIASYKVNATNRVFLAGRVEEQLRDLVRLAHPFPYAMAIRRMDGLVPASDWSIKFYEGLESNGEMSIEKRGCRGQTPAIVLKHLTGSHKFGAERTFRSDLTGNVAWTVSAEAKCMKNGEAGVAMEFFDTRGRSLGIVNGERFKPQDWTTKTWRFSAPKKAATAEVHLLSLAEGPVMFANVCVRDAAGEEDTSIALNAYALPSRWNSAWNGGHERFTSFAEAPLPMAFHFKGDRAQLKSPALEIEIPADLELRDSFSEHAKWHGAEKPVADIPILNGGRAYRRLRFEKLRVFEILGPTYLWERKLAIVIGPKDGAAAAGRSCEVFWRVMDGKTIGDSGVIDLRFVSLPREFRAPKRFDVISWQSDDRLFSSDRALFDAAKAYEMAGVTTFVRRDMGCPRGVRIAELLTARNKGWRFMVTFSDSLDVRFLDCESPEFKALGVRMAERNDGKPMKHPLLCPEYFNKDPAFHAYFRDHVVVPRLRATGIRAGDMVSGDIEPWGPKYFCTCRKCREAFAAHCRLESVPGPRDILSRVDEWTSFRSLQTEESVAKLAKIVREYDPGVKIIDYDYVILYGTEHEKSFLHGCSKSAALDDKWVDAHICSYYHICDKNAFEAIRNNTQKLKSDYYPFGAIAGANSYLRDGEERAPAHVRQLALAAAVHGCPGIGFYKGIHYDGEHLLALMKARSEIAAVEDFPWGKRGGALKAVSANSELAFATSADESREIVALFNYDAEASLTATVTHQTGGVFSATDPVSGRRLAAAADLSAGYRVEIPAGDVRFVVFAPRGE